MKSKSGFSSVLLQNSSHLLLVDEGTSEHWDKQAGNHRGTESTEVNLRGALGLFYSGVTSTKG